MLNNAQRLPKERTAIAVAPTRINTVEYISKRARRRIKKRSPIAARSFLFPDVNIDIASPVPEKKHTYNDETTMACTTSGGNPSINATKDVRTNKSQIENRIPISPPNRNLNPFRF
jgi:hypothetical protein